MQAVMAQQKSAIEGQLLSTLRSASVHCRRDSLWQKLFAPSSGFVFADLMEMVDLVSVSDVATPGLSVSSSRHSPLSKSKARYQVKSCLFPHCNINITYSAVQCY